MRTAGEFHGSVSRNDRLSYGSQGGCRLVAHGVDDVCREVYHTVVEGAEVEVSREASVARDRNRSGNGPSRSVADRVMRGGRGFPSSGQTGERHGCDAAASDDASSVKLEVRWRVRSERVDEERLRSRRGRISGLVVRGDADVRIPFGEGSRGAGRARGSRCGYRGKIRSLGDLVRVRRCGESGSGVGGWGPRKIDVRYRSRDRRRLKTERGRRYGVHEERPFHDGRDEILGIAVLHPDDVIAFCRIGKRNQYRS